MEIDQSLLLAVGITFAGSLVAALAGFGFSLIVVPPLLLIYDPPTVTAMVMLVTLATRWVLLTDTWRATRWRTVVALLPTAFLGIALGVALVREVDASYIKLLASVVVIIAATSLIAGWQPSNADSPLAPPLAGLMSGTLNTSTGMDGPPVIMLFTSRRYSMAQLRSSITIYYYLISPVGLAALIQQGLVGSDELRIAAAMIPGVMAGTLLGQFLVRRISPAHFRSGVLGLLLVTGVVGAIAAVLEIA